MCIFVCFMYKGKWSNDFKICLLNRSVKIDFDCSSDRKGGDGKHFVHELTLINMHTYEAVATSASSVSVIVVVSLFSLETQLIHQRQTLLCVKLNEFSEVSLDINIKIACNNDVFVGERMRWMEKSPSILIGPN